MPDHTHIDNTVNYYNLTYINNSNQQVPAQASETRTSPILRSAGDWLMSVIRFDVDAHSIPINIPNTISPTGSPGSGNFITTSTITLRYLGNIYTQPIIYLNDAVTIPYLTQVPTIYNYQRWLDFVNTAASLAFTASGAVGSPPIFIWDPLTKLINCYVDQNYIPAAGANKIEIFINEELYIYFTNFQFLFSNTTSNNPDLLYLFNITNFNTDIMPAVGSRQNLPISIQAITNLYLYRQLEPGTASWNSIRSIILTSNLIPFRPESIPNKPTSQSNNASSSQSPILSDFLVGVNNEVTLDRVKLEYLPTAQYRYIDLLGDNPFYTIDIQFYWSDFNGNINPIALIPGAGLSVKILFQKRNNLLLK